MRKLTLLLLATVITSLNALAIPAYPKAIPMPQPDGTTLSVKLVGDEYHHYNTTTDGYTIMLNEAGAYVYAQRDDNTLKPTSVLAHDEGNRDMQELTLLERTEKFITDRGASLKAKAARRAPRNVDLSEFDWDNFHGLVILIDFTDRTFSMDDPKAFFSMQFNTENLKSYVDPFNHQTVNCQGSVYDYFTEQSNGIFKPHFDVFGPYTSSYRSDQFTDRNTQSIFRTILNEADAEVNFANYDGNHDGKVDMVYFLVAGYSAAMGNNENYLWPHESVLDAARKDGKLLDRYSSSTEFYGQLAQQYHIVLVTSLFERRAAGLYHNTAVVFDTDGTIAGCYRKMHIPDDPAYYEKFYFTPGDLGFQPIQTSLGRLGVQVCWDQWYPEGARLMALQGAELLIYPTAIGYAAEDTPEEQERQREAWTTVQRGHAVANGLPVITVNRVGHEPDPSGQTRGIQFWGSSFVAGPQGELLYRAPKDQEENAVIEVDLHRSEQVRRWWPFLRDRRIDSFSGLTERFLDS